MNLTIEQINLPEIYNLNPDAEQQRLSLTTLSSGITSVSNPNEQSAAISAGSSIRKYVKDVEAARVELTAPLLEAQRKLKKLADEHVGPLNAELTRVSRLVVQFQTQEAERVERERKAQALAYELAEKARLEAEQAAQKAAEKVNTDRQLDRAIQKEKEAQEAAQAVQQVLAAPAPTLNRATGASMRKVLRWEVTDIHALYKARPELCKIEAKASAIQSMCVPELPVPGLDLRWETTASIRG